MVGEIDRFPVKDLPNRYGIARSVLYTRMQKLGIKPTKESNKSYINGEDLKQLDELDQHLTNGGTIAQFSDQTDSRTDTQDTMTEAPAKYNHGNRTDSLEKQDRQTEQLSIPGLFYELINTAIEATENKRSGLNDLRDLQEIANNNWTIPTRRLASIINRSRSYFRGKNQVYYCGFVFEKVRKQGNEFLWKVNRED